MKLFDRSHTAQDCTKSYKEKKNIKIYEASCVLPRKLGPFVHVYDGCFKNRGKLRTFCPFYRLFFINRRKLQTVSRCDP